MQLIPAWLMQTAVASQFYFYGRKHFTQNGWNRASALYTQPDQLTSADLSSKVFVVTGATSGLGKDVAQLLGAQGATVYVVVRGDAARAESAAAAVREACGNEQVHGLVADVSLAADVRRVSKELDEKLGPNRGLDGLVCNAGALLSTRTLTAEGEEITVATHLLHGTYLLANQLRPTLQRAPDPRVVVVTSGGMYTQKWPGMAVADSTADPEAYEGNAAYAYAKRGQVLLVDQWAKREAQQPKPINFMSVHPGWVDTPGVASAYGRTGKVLLSPLRTPYQGAEGIAWLCAAPKQELHPGALYLDRQVQPFHLPGGYLLNRGGHATKNTDGEVEELLASLEAKTAETCRKAQAAETVAK